MKRILSNIDDNRDCNKSMNEIIYSENNYADSKDIKVKEESIEINCPIKVDEQILNIDLSVLNNEEKIQFYNLLKKIQQPKAWKPKAGENYFYINQHAEVMNGNWSNESVDIGRYSIGNCFKTGEEIKFTIEKLKVEAEIRRYIEANDTEKIDWNNSKQHKCYLIYLHIHNMISVKYANTTMIQGPIYFSKNINVDDMIKTIGADRIKKYLFGVE